MHLGERHLELDNKASLHWQAMGSPCELTVWIPGADAATQAHILALLQRRIGMLESAWSRFDENSEVSQLNRAAGTGKPTSVSGDTWLLITRMIDASIATGGLYDPTVSNAMRAHGYDRTYAEVTDRGPSDLTGITVPGVSEIILDHDNQTVMLAESASLDAGGIGKGLAGDILTTDLIDAGIPVRGIIVNIGGDIVISGAPGADDAWVVAVRDEAHPDSNLGTVTVAPMPFGVNIGIATSTTLTRRWTADGQPRHHVIDPDTAMPATTGLTQATAVAPAGWMSEAAATAALLMNSRAENWLNGNGIPGLIAGNRTVAVNNDDLVRIEVGS